MSPLRCSTKAEVVGFLRSQRHFLYDQRTAYTGTAECEAKTSPSDKKSKRYEDASAILHTNQLINLFWCRMSSKSSVLRNNTVRSHFGGRGSASIDRLSVTHSHATVPGQMDQMSGIDLHHPRVVGSSLGLMLVNQS